MTKQDYSPERLSDRAQIQDVMHRWCRAVDRLDLDAIRDLFHLDATDSHGLFNGDVEGLISWIGTRHTTIPFSMHFISNIFIEFSGRDTAIVETYCLAVQRYTADAKVAMMTHLSGGVQGEPETEMDMMVCCRYVDRFERRNGEWRIAKRVVVYDSIMTDEVPKNGPKMSTGWTSGQRNKTDYIHQARIAAGVAGG